MVKTTDIHVAAFLMCQGHNLEETEQQQKGNKTLTAFVFPDDVKQDIQSYFNGAQVPAITYKNKLMNCRTIMFDVSK